MQDVGDDHGEDGERGDNTVSALDRFRSGGWFRGAVDGATGEDSASY